MTPTSMFSRSLTALLALAPLSACDTGSSDPDALDAELQAEELDTEELAADTQYMRDVFAERDTKTAMPIDLSDDRQYRFLIGRLQSADVTPLTAPELYDRIGAARLRASNDLVPRTAANDRCDMFVTPDDVPEGTLGTIGRSSCVDGSDYSLLQVCHYDDIGNLLDCTVEEEFGAGINNDVVTHTITEMGFADGVSYHLTDSTEEFYYYVSALTTTATDLRLLMAHPQDLNSDGSVQVCLERSTWSPDCDYKHATSGTCASNDICNGSDQPLFPVFNPNDPVAGQGQYNNDRLYMPMKSHGTYLVPNGSVVNSARAWLTLRSSGDSTPAGGLCTADFSSSPYLTFQPAFNSFQRMEIAPFALDIGNAVWPDHCVDNRAAVDLHVEVNLQTGSSARTYSWSSSRDYDHIAIAWGCLPPGTMITLPEGQQIAIEDIEVGDRVMADDDGGVLTVVDVLTGHEAEPLVVVENSLGHVVPMTATHAVPTVERGIVSAADLQVGDRLDTEDGISYVVSVDREEYEGEVYNLVLGTPEELEARGNQTTMVANGVVVGDSRMQGKLKIEDSKADDARRAQAEIPAELYVDYLGSKVRGLVRELKG